MPPMYRYPDDYEFPACDLCGSPDSLDTRQVLLENAKDTKMDLVQCTGCGLRFFSPRPKWSVLKHLIADERQQAECLYENCSFYPVEDKAAQRASIRSYYWRMLEDVVGVLGHKPTSYFELGGSVGWFAVTAREFGVLGPYFGCDINEHAARIARAKQGLPWFIAKDFADYKPWYRYELIVCLDYLEHTYTPWQDLQKLAAMLQPGGVLLAKTFLDELDVNHEQLSPPSHAIHWTTDVLRGAVERAGLEIKNWKIDFGGYQVILIAQKPVEAPC